MLELLMVYTHILRYVKRVYRVFRQLACHSNTTVLLARFAAKRAEFAFVGLEHALGDGFDIAWGTWTSVHSTFGSADGPRGGLAGCNSDLAGGALSDERILVVLGWRRRRGVERGRGTTADRTGLLAVREHVARVVAALSSLGPLVAPGVLVDAGRAVVA